MDQSMTGIGTYFTNTSERNSNLPAFPFTGVQNCDLTSHLHIENSSKFYSEKISRTLLQSNELGYRYDLSIH
jgi:hypothetical protein